MNVSETYVRRKWNGYFALFCRDYMAEFISENGEEVGVLFQRNSYGGVMEYVNNNFIHINRYSSNCNFHQRIKNILPSIVNTLKNEILP